MKSLRESLEAEKEQKAKLEKVRHLDLLWPRVFLYLIFDISKLSLQKQTGDFLFECEKKSDNFFQ